jgi:DNA-binding response OmpR family regulator
MEETTLRDKPTAKKVCLVVAADPPTEAFLGNLLGQLGWSLERAASNEAALQRVQSNFFELIVTGEKTSGKQDVELLAKIRKLHPHTRMIILADESTPNDVIASMRARAFSYFSKPISYETLSDMVRMALEEPTWDDGIEVISATPSWIRLFARCEPKTAERVVQFIMEVIDLPGEEKGQVAYAFREILTNVRSRHVVACRVKDPGAGFSLDELRHAAVANPPEDPLRHVTHRQSMGLPPGGYGILLAKHMVDEVIYGEHGNDVLLIKYLQGLPAEVAGR